MDGTTEPIIAVIGHPIAGNPSQFAIERALAALELEWRVLSFDVHPDHIAAALEGFKVTGIAGVMIDPSVRPIAANWYATKVKETADQAKRDVAIKLADAQRVAASSETPAAVNQAGSGTIDQATAEVGQKPKSILDPAILVIQSIDCLYRDKSMQFRASCEQQGWVDELVAEYESSARLWVGARDVSLPIQLSQFEDANVVRSASPDRIANARVIVLGNRKKIRASENDAPEPVKLDLEDWPANDGSTTIIDLTDEHPAGESIVRLGYRWVGSHQLRVATLTRCFNRWTGHDSSPDVISDAIEEYLGV